MTVLFSENNQNKEGLCLKICQWGQKNTLDSNTIISLIPLFVDVFSTNSLNFNFKLDKDFEDSLWCPSRLNVLRELN